MITSITPTAFTMRALGERLTLSPLPPLPHGELVMDADFEITRLVGFQSFNGEPQPQITSRKITSKFVLKPNEPSLLGTCTAAQRTGSEFESKEDTVSFAFLTARSLPQKADSPQDVVADDLELSASFEVISLPKGDASLLVEEGLDESTFHGRLKSSIKNGAAKLETFLNGRVGFDPPEPLEEADEFSYPTEFDPPQIPTSLLIADDDLLADLRAGRQTGTGVAPPHGNPHNGGFGWMTTVTPLNFSTRMLGTKLEIEVTRDGQQATLKIRPQLTRLIGEKQYLGTTQPLFESELLSSTTTARLDIPHLIGTLSRPFNTGLTEGNQEDRIWFAFVTIRRSR